jgi:hypothetical protein
MLDQIDRAIAALSDNGDRFRAAQAKMAPDDLYPVMMNQARADLLQLLQVFSDRVDFLCRFEEGFSATMSKDLGGWGDMLTDMANILTDQAASVKF